MIGNPEFDYLTHLEGLRGKDAKKSDKSEAASGAESENITRTDRPRECDPSR